MSVGQAPPRRSVRSIFRSVGLLLTGKAMAGLMSLGYLAMVTRILGAQDYGILILLHAYITLVGGIVAFSGWHGVVRYGSLAFREGDHGRLMRLIRFMTLVELACGLLAIAVAVALVQFVGPHLHWSAKAMVLAVPYSLAILANVRSTPNGILQIVGRFDLISAHQLINPAVRLVGSLTVLLAGGGLEAILAVWLAASVAEGVGMWFFGLRELGRMRIVEPLLGTARNAVAENEGLLPFIVTNNVDLTMGELGPKLAPLTVGWLLGPAAAGLFALAQRASIILQQPAIMLGQASFSVITKLLAAGEVERFSRSVWHTSGLAVLAAIPVTFALALFADPIILLLGGTSFSGGAPLLTLLACSRALLAGSTTLSSGLIALGRPGRSVSASLAGNLGLYPLLPALLLFAGLNGAGWHALIQSIVIVATLTWFFRRSVKEHASRTLAQVP